MIVGPSGKDVYPCVIVLLKDSEGRVDTHACLVEAVSREEAWGIANEISIKVAAMPQYAGKGFRRHIEIGPSQVITPENVVLS